jgi:hypothetical protein
VQLPTARMTRQVAVRTTVRDDGMQGIAEKVMVKLSMQRCLLAAALLTDPAESTGRRACRCKRKERL